MSQLSIPALNKWTTVSPSATVVAAMQHFCGIFPKVFRECFPVKPSGRCSSSEDEQDEAAQLGQPIDQTKQWRRLARKRQRKAGVYLSDEASSFRTLLWAVVTAPVMKIHFALFKRATWFCERSRPDEPESEDDLSSTAAFIKAALSPATKCIRLLGNALADPSHDLWLPLQGSYTPAGRGADILLWPQDNLRTTRRCVVTLTGQMWRKLIETWDRYPWKLTELLQGSEDERLDSAKKLLAMKPCCLDGFTAKLFNICSSPESLAGQETLDFLRGVFDRVVPTSTFVERMFARFGKWVETKGHRLHMSQLVAKHFTNTFSSLVESWREKERKKGNIARPRSQKHRPLWAFAGRQRLALTGLHLFTEDFLSSQDHREEAGEDQLARATRAWRVLSADERRRWKFLAKGRNRQQRMAIGPVSNVLGGPWNLGSSDGFPLSRHIVIKHMDKRKSMAKDFCWHYNLLQPENFDSMDVWPDCTHNLFALCSSRSCISRLSEDQKAVFDEVLKVLIYTIMSYAPLPLTATEEPMVLAFASLQQQSTGCVTSDLELMTYLYCPANII